MYNTDGVLASCNTRLISGFPPFLVLISRDQLLLPTLRTLLKLCNFRDRRNGGFKDVNT